MRAYNFVTKGDHKKLSAASRTCSIRTANVLLITIGRHVVCQIYEFRKFVNFVKNQYFRHEGQLSSFRQFFVKTKSFGA